MNSSLSDRIIDSKLINDPWPHKIIDNFFDDETFHKLQYECSLLMEKLGTDDIKKDAIDLHKLIPMNDTVIDPVLLANKNILCNIDKILNSFPYSRTYSEYFSIPSFYFLKKASGEFPVHDEALEKTLSIVVYIYPTLSAGTNIYKTPNEYSHTVNWVPNRALIFCGEKNKTWHNFGAKDEDRITLNFFIRSNYINTIIESDTEFTIKMPDDRIVIVPKNSDTLAFKQLYDQGLLTP
jgi:hypothetical protein